MDVVTTKWCSKSQTLDHRTTENETNFPRNAAGPDRRYHVSDDIAGTGAHHQIVAPVVNSNLGRLFVCLLLFVVCGTMRRFSVHTPVLEFGPSHAFPSM